MRISHHIDLSLDQPDIIKEFREAVRRHGCIVKSVSPIRPGHVRLTVTGQHVNLVFADMMLLGYVAGRLPITATSWL